MSTAINRDGHDMFHESDLPICKVCNKRISYLEIQKLAKVSYQERFMVKCHGSSDAFGVDPTFHGRMRLVFPTYVFIEEAARLEELRKRQENPPENSSAKDRVEDSPTIKMVRAMSPERAKQTLINLLKNAELNTQGEYDGRRHEMLRAQQPPHAMREVQDIYGNAHPMFNYNTPANVEKNKENKKEKEWNVKTVGLQEIATDASIVKRYSSLTQTNALPSPSSKERDTK